jgi:hypothetical protein
MTLPILAVVFGVSLPVQPPGSTGTTVVAVQGIRAGCSPDSMSVALAGALAAREMGRWQCMFQVIGNQPQKLSVAGFYLDFIELHHVDPPDVGDVFLQKQKLSKAAKAARICEFIGIAALIATGQSYWKPAADVVKALGVGTYGAAKLGEYFKGQVPPTANALSNILTEDVTLQPGESRIFKVYASLVHGAHSLGPRMLTQPEGK